MTQAPVPSPGRIGNTYYLSADRRVTSLEGDEKTWQRYWASLPVRHISESFSLFHALLGVSRHVPGVELWMLSRGVLLTHILPVNFRLEEVVLNSKCARCCRSDTANAAGRWPDRNSFETYRNRQRHTRSVDTSPRQTLQFE